MDEEFKLELISTFKEMVAYFTEQYRYRQKNIDSLSLIASVISVFLFVFIVIKIFGVFFAYQNDRKQSHLFRKAMSNTAGSSSDFDTKSHDNSKKTDPQSDKAQKEKQEMRELAVCCEELGEKIDSHTDRYHYSRYVSLLVYRIANAMHLDDRIAALYFCIGMVFDAGYLDLPENLFFMDICSPREQKILKTHVERYQSCLSFIPEKYLAEFISASMYHHENYDGSGYPEGVRGNNIPLIARIIHVAEDYVTLVTKRRYQRRLEKHAAIRELRKREGILDMSIVDVLEKLI